MAITTLSSFRTPIISSGAPRNRKAAAVPAQSSHWWAPIFGVPSEPDYFDKVESDLEVSGRSDKELSRIASEKKPFRGCLTADKAKELRKKMIETSSFHDIMYHSAIASRLASDISGR